MTILSLLRRDQEEEFQYKDSSQQTEEEASESALVRLHLRLSTAVSLRLDNAVGGNSSGGGAAMSIHNRMSSFFTK